MGPCAACCAKSGRVYNGAINPDLALPVGVKRRILSACLLVACVLTTAPAQTIVTPSSDGIRPEHIWTLDYLKLVLGDTKSVLTAPARWDEDEWIDAGIATLGVGVTAAFDHTIRTQVQAHRSAGEDRFMKSAQNFDTFFLLGGFELWGEVGGDQHAKNVAMDGIAASIIASGVITPVLKYTVGRVRPYNTTATFKFKPFTSNYSFPSGHATQAFAVATVIAENYPVWWVEGLSYGGAALIGYARSSRTPTLPATSSPARSSAGRLPGRWCTGTTARRTRGRSAGAPTPAARARASCSTRRSERIFSRKGAEPRRNKRRRG